MWNDISFYLFEMMVVGLDKMKCMFIGMEFIKILVFVFILFEKVLVYYEFIFNSWKMM